MALTYGFLAVSLAMHFWGVEAYYGSTEEEETKYVTCQSAVRLAHQKSGEKYVLSSLNGQNYGSGSRQQVVTFSPQKSESASLWVIRQGHEESTACEAGEPIQCNSYVRLTHNDSQRNLHSHRVKASLSGQNEVSGYGNDGEGDGGDDWRVECVEKTKYWERGKSVMLYHASTQAYLQCHPNAEFTRNNCGGNCPIMNHLEVGSSI